MVRTPLVAAALNNGILPPDFVALVKQITDGPEPDVVALSLPIQDLNYAIDRKKKVSTGFEMLESDEMLVISSPK